MEDLKLDLQTLQFIRHLFAGKLTNIKGGAEFILSKHGEPEKWAEIIKRDSKSITDKLNELIVEQQ